MGRTVPDFQPARFPESDLIIATAWPTVRFAHDAGQGIPAHLCQGYEGDFPENRRWQEQIEFAYRLHTVKLVVSPHLGRLLRDRKPRPRPGKGWTRSTAPARPKYCRGCRQEL